MNFREGTPEEIVNHERLDEIRQELSYMDYSAIPNAELAKLYSAIDVLRDETTEFIKKLNLLRSIIFYDPQDSLKDREDAPVWYFVETMEKRINDTDAILDQLTLHITWADDWNNTKEMLLAEYIRIQDQKG
jgi:hypothetical protein